MTDEMYDWLEAFGNEVLRMAERDEHKYSVHNPLNPTGRTRPGDPATFLTVVHISGIRTILDLIGPPPVLLYSLDDEAAK